MDARALLIGALVKEMFEDTKRDNHKPYIEKEENI
jgi:hypothetical protein